MEASIIIFIHLKTHRKSVVNDSNFYGDTTKGVLLLTTLLWWSGGSFGGSPSGLPGFFLPVVRWLPFGSGIRWGSKYYSLMTHSGHFTLLTKGKYTLCSFWPQFSVFMFYQSFTTVPFIKFSLFLLKHYNLQKPVKQTTTDKKCIVCNRPTPFLNAKLKAMRGFFRKARIHKEFLDK